jgi:hypothetical protein
MGIPCSQSRAWIDGGFNNAPLPPMGDAERESAYEDMVRRSDAYEDAMLRERREADQREEELVREEMAR